MNNYYRDRIEEANANINREQRRIELSRSNIRKTQANIDDENSKKKNLEKRLKQVIKIIRYLESDVDASFSSISNKASSSQKGFNRIKTVGIKRGSIEKKFKSKSVVTDKNTGNALQHLKNERGKIEQDIERINAAINKLNDTVSSLQRNIRTYESSILGLRRDIRRYRNSL